MSILCPPPEGVDTRKKIEIFIAIFEKCHKCFDYMIRYGGG